MWRRDSPRSFGSGPTGQKHLVASTTDDRRPRRARPTISSDSPFEYMSAVSIGVDAGVEGGVDDPDAVIVVGVAERSEGHGAEAEDADLDAAGAENPHLHGVA